MAKRWAEYLTFVATSLFVPLEVWELTVSQTPLKVAALLHQPGDPRLPAVGEAPVRRPWRVPPPTRPSPPVDVGWESLERTTPR